MLPFFLAFSDSKAPYGKNGYYFSENGTFSWRELSVAVVNPFRKRNRLNVIDVASNKDTIAMSQVLWCDVKMVPIIFAGK